MRIVLICIYFLKSTQAIYCPWTLTENNFCYVKVEFLNDHFMREETPYWKYKDFPEIKETQLVPISAKYDYYSGLYRSTEKSFNYKDVLDFNNPVMLPQPREDCVLVENSDVVPVNCFSQPPEQFRMYFFEDKNTFCKQYDLICSAAGDKTGCYCTGSYGGFFCTESCIEVITTDLECSSCGSAFEAYPEPTLTLKISTTKIFLTTSNYLKLKMLTDTIPAACYVDTRPRVYNPVTDSNPTVQFSFILIEETDNERTYELVMEGGLVLGRYHCTGFVYPTLDSIDSNTVYYRPVSPVNDFIFVVKTAVQFDIFQNPFVQIASEINSKLQFPFEVSIISIENENVIAHLQGQTRNYYEDVDAAYSKVKAIYPDVLNSEYCMSLTTTYDEDQIIFWDLTYIGQIAVSSPLCTEDLGNALTATCIGDTVSGAQWKFNFDENNLNCKRQSDGTTNELLEILASDAPPSELTNNILDSISSNDDFESLDIYLMGKILQKIANANESFPMHNFAEVLSKIMDIDPEILGDSQNTFNATDLILGSLDQALVNYANNFMELEVVATTKNLNLHLFKMAEYNVNAVMYYQNGSSKIFSSARITEIFEDEFIAGVFLPQSVITQVREETVNESKPSLVSALFRKDTLFSSKHLKKSYRITGWISDVIITDFLSQLLEAPITVAVKPYRRYRQNHYCTFWKFGIDDNYRSLNGYWEQESLAKKFGEYYLCEYWHMTHYALLLDLPSNDALDVVSIVTSGVSIIGMVLIFLTACLSKNWRESPTSKVALCSSFVLVVQMISLPVSKTIDSYKQETACIIIGTILHYTVISQFFWMLVVGILQYRKFIFVFVNPSQWLFVACFILGWMVPIFPVVVTLMFSLRSYISDQYCYLTGNGLYFGVFLPIGLILTFNIIIFARIFGKFCCSKKVECYGDRESKTKLYLRLAIFLFFTMGLTWIFGLLNGFLKVECLSYLFCLTACMQGGVMFWFYVVLNQHAVNSWKKVFLRSCFCCSKEIKN